jgi:cysteine-rich repeat protein
VRWTALNGFRGRVTATIDNFEACNAGNGAVGWSVLDDANSVLNSCNFANIHSTGTQTCTVPLHSMAQESSVTLIVGMMGSNWCDGTYWSMKFESCDECSGECGGNTCQPSQQCVDSVSGYDCVDPEIYVSFSASTLSTAENVGSSLQVVRGGTGAGNAFTVDVTFSFANASASDIGILPVTQTVNFGTGVATVNVPISVLDDTIAEATEVLMATLSNANVTSGDGSVNISVTEPFSAIIIIAANDPFTVAFNAPALSTRPDAGTVALTVIRTGVGRGAFTIDVTFGGTAGDNATATADYDASTITISFGENATTRTVFVPIVNDPLSGDRDEVFSAHLANLVYSAGNAAIDMILSTCLVTIKGQAYVASLNSPAEMSVTSTFAAMSLTMSNGTSVVGGDKVSFASTMTNCSVGPRVGGEHAVTPGNNLIALDPPITTAGTYRPCYQSTSDPTHWYSLPSPTVIVVDCGNGVVEGSEGCDDGNTVSGDGCSSSCEVETAADTGNPFTCSGTTPSTCSLCGNRKVEAGEACDDGNTAIGDGCSSTCTVEAAYTCTADPLTPSQSLCTSPGNGKVEGTEQCDDGNTVDGDGCSAAGLIETGSSCFSPAPGGISTCSSPGNGAIEPGETCDDGNTVDGDGCSAAGQIEVGFNCLAASGVTPSRCGLCGNGIVEPSEQC